MFPLQMNELIEYLLVDVATQKLFFFKNQLMRKVYPISTGAKGVGEALNSGCTPRGWHQIRAKIGAQQPINTVFVRRRPTGEIYTPALGRNFPERDWILTRILWLSGLEIGKNRLGKVDTMQRYIYLHGTPETNLMGSPASKGCIRMNNQDIIELFDAIPVGMRVFIQG